MNNHREISPAMSITPERCDAVSITVPLSNSKAGNFVMKRCLKCKVVKQLDMFCRVYGKPHSSCKQCEKERITNYYRTKEGLIRQIYYTQKTRKNIQGMPEYTSDELAQWLYTNPLFYELYDKWVESGYDSWMRPSIDRIDDYKCYSFNNIQLMTWRENQDKAYRDRKNGINNKASLAVIQFDLEGNYIKEYYSVVQAGRETGFCRQSIGRACKGIQSEAKGYKWVYKKDYINN